MAGKMGNYIYIVECTDGTWYTGWTNDLVKRIAAHNSGRGAKYTRSRRPVRLVYSEEFETSVEAQRREYAVKRMTRQEKEALVAGCVEDPGHTKSGKRPIPMPADGN